MSVSLRICQSTNRECGKNIRRDWLVEHVLKRFFTGHSSVDGIVSAYHGRLPLLRSPVVSTPGRYPRDNLRSMGKDHVLRLWHITVRASHSSLRPVPRRVLPVLFDLSSRRAFQTVDSGSSLGSQEENRLNHLSLRFSVRVRSGIRPAVGWVRLIS